MSHNFDFPLLTVSILIWDIDFLVPSRTRRSPTPLPVRTYHAFVMVQPESVGRRILLQICFDSRLDNLTTHMPLPVVPEGLISLRRLERSMLVAFGSFDMSFLRGYLQPQQLPKVCFFPPVCYTIDQAFEAD